MSFRPLLAFAALLSLGVLGGCTRGTIQQQPAAIPVREAPAAAPAAAEPGGTPEEAKTFRFGLEESISLALRNNLSLMNAADQVKRSEFNIRAAAAEFEVKVTPRASAGLSGGSGGTSTTTGGGLGVSKRTGIGTRGEIFGETTRTGDTNRTGTGIELTQPLLRGLGKTVNEDFLLDAKFGALSSERSYAMFQEGIVVSVVRAFYEIVRQREILALNDKSARRTQGHLEAARAREKVGLASRIDVLRAEIQLRQAQDNLLAAQEASGDAVDRFRILLGFGPQDNVEIDSDLTYNEFAVDAQGALDLALANRLDLVQARDEIGESERNLRVARNNTLPQLDLVVGYEQYGTGPGFSSSSRLNESTWSVALSTSTDLRRTAQRMYYEQAKLDVEARERNLKLLGDTVAREVNDALRRLERNSKRIDVQKAEMEHAQQKLRLARIKFDRGLGDNFDLMSAEEDVIRAETAWISAVTDYIVSQAEFKKAVGTLVERPSRLAKPQ